MGFIRGDVSNFISIQLIYVIIQYLKKTTTKKTKLGTRSWEFYTLLSNQCHPDIELPPFALCCSLYPPLFVYSLSFIFHSVFPSMSRLVDEVPRDWITLCMPQAKQLLRDYCETSTLPGLEHWTSFPFPYLPRPTRGNAQLHKNMLIDAENNIEIQPSLWKLIFWGG